MKNYLKIITVSSLVLFMIFSCTDDFERMNTSRSLVTQEIVDIDMMFTRVLAVSIVNAEDGFGTTGNWCGMSVSTANRPFELGESNGIWNSTYGHWGRNLADIINLCTIREDAPNLVNKKAIARIMKVWAFARCTDTYGDIPYFESCLPIEQAVTTPKYDLQKEIYADFFKELKEAVAEMDDSKPDYGDADILYGGDLAKWKKFANSLRLRLAIRIRYADPDMAKAAIADLSEADFITQRSEDASIYNITDYPDHENDRYRDLVSRQATVDKDLAAKTLLDILKDNDDPRLYVFIDTVNAWFPQTPGYEDVPYFGFRGRPLLSGENPDEGRAYGDNTTSRISDLFWVQIQEFPLYKASETYFTLAEAALFNIKAGDAQQLYKKGVQLALEHAKELYDKAVPQLPAVVSLFKAGKSQAEKDQYLADLLEAKKITQDQIDDFLENSPAVVLSGTDEEKLEQIINQKVVALFPQEFEGWCEHRRTGYPRILVGQESSALQGRMPRRFPYPSSESLLNKKQLAIALDRMGGVAKDTRLTRFWWQANPDPYKKHPGTVETRTTPWVSE